MSTDSAMAGRQPKDYQVLVLQRVGEMAARRDGEAGLVGAFLVLVPAHR